MKQKTRGKILEKSLMWMFKAYARNYLFSEQGKSKARVAAKSLK